MKKIYWAILLAGIVSTGLFTACNKQAGVAAAGADPYANAPREVSMTVLDRGQIPAAEGTYEDNRWVRWINENSPVKVTFVPVTRSDATSKINALFAAGNAPDIVWEYNKSFMDGLYAQGVIQPVGDYVEKYSVAYKQYLKDNPQIVPYLMEDDGKMYGISSQRNILGIVNQSIWIRNDWVQKFNMKIPTTTDEAIAFMRRVRDEDPDGNGQKDTFGMSSNYGWGTITRTMFGNPYDGFMVKDGHYVDWASTPAYRENLAFKRQLYTEGLMDPEFITDNNYARQRQLIVTGKVGMIFQGLSITGEWRELMQNVPTADFIPIEPLETNQGRFGFNSEVPILKMVVMNKTARNPKAIMEYLDWLITDGYYALSWGEEGRHYKLVNGIPQTIDAERNKIEKDWLSGNYEFALVDNNKITLDWIPIQAAQDPISQAWAKVYQQAVDIGIRNPWTYVVPYGPASDTIAAYNSSVAAQLEALETNIMTGKISVDEGLKQINDYKKASGWDAVIAEKDAWYQKNKHLF
ncbi:lipoprotein LipO [Spirochaetia bacterium]|nr:lipoprotein LipO [Spirochaetia bacterium]